MGGRLHCCIDNDTRRERSGGKNEACCIEKKKMTMIVRVEVCMIGGHGRDKDSWVMSLGGISHMYCRHVIAFLRRINAFVEKKRQNKR